MKGKNILIAISAMDMCDTHFMFSMVRMIQMHPEYDVLPRMGSECHVSRDWLCFYAIQNNYDYICIIDSDEEFKPNDIEVLLSDDKDIVGGIVCKHEYPYEPVLYSYDEDSPTSPWNTIREIPKGLQAVDALGGGGMLLVKTTALMKIRSCTGELFFPMNHWSDDLSFFYRAKQCGLQPYVDGRVKIGHRGKQTVTTEFWEAVADGRDEA